MKRPARSALILLCLAVLAVSFGCSQESNAGAKMTPEVAAQASEANQRKNAHNMH